MTALRLIRRLLLCSIVGITVFGVSGWLLLPAPSWECILGGSSTPFRLAGPTTIEHDDHPIWVFAVGVNGFDYDPKLNGVVACVSPQGRLIRRHVLPIGEPSVANDGCLVLSNQVSSSKDSEGGKRTEYLILDPGNHDVVARVLDGDWRICGSGLLVRQFRRISDRVACTIFDLQTNTRVSDFELPGRRFREDDGDFALSPDGKLLAVSDRSRTDGRKPTGVELYDARTGRLVKRIVPTLKETERGSLPAYLCFIQNGRTLLLQWRDLDGTGEIQDPSLFLGNGTMAGDDPQ